MINSKHIELNLKDQILLDKAIRIIVEHLEDEAFGVEDLRLGLGLSRSQLHRRLHKISGLSTSQFIRAIRLKNAFELLLEGKLSVSEVAYRTGFSNPSYFSKCFHDQYDFPPGDVHKQKIAEIDRKNIFYPQAPADRTGYKQGSRLLKRGVYTILIFILIVTLGAITYWMLTRVVPVDDDKISIAVLPFKNFSEQQENQYISDGIMEAVIANISKIGSLRVISRTSMERYRATSKSVKQIGSELGVSHILEGSTFQADRYVRVTVQLINSKTDEHVWSESYESEMKDIFLVQSQIAKRIARELELNITPEEMQLIERHPTSIPKAYDLYQQAFFFFVRYLQQRNEADYQKCKSLFNASLVEDSTFAAAYARLADLYWNRNYRTEYHSDTFMDTVYLLSNKALNYDPQSSDAHRLLGQYYFETGNREKAITELEKSISMNSNNASAYEVLGFYYNWIGAWEKGIPLIYKAIHLDPLSIFVSYRYNYLARAYLDLLDFDNAFLYSQRAIEFGGGVKPAIGFGHWIIAHTHLMLGNSKEALMAAEKISAFNEISGLRIKAEVYCHLLQDFDKGIQLYQELANKDPGHFNYKHRYAYALWQVGKYDSAKFFFDTQVRDFEKELSLGRVGRNDPHYNLAGIHAFFNEPDSAILHLKQHKFTSGLEVYIERDPLFINIYKNPEFQQIIRLTKNEKAQLRARIKSESPD